MDRFEKHAEYIMKRGDRILAEKEKKARTVRRISFSFAGVFAAVIVGFFAWRSVPPPDDMSSDIITPPTTATSSAEDLTTSETTSLVTKSISTSKTSTQPTVTTTAVSKTLPSSSTGTISKTTATTQVHTVQTVRQTSITTATHTQTATSTTDNAYKETPTTSTTTGVIQEGPGICSTTTSIESPEPSFNAQPIMLNGADKAIDTIKQNDVSSYAEEYRNAYRRMFDRFNNDGVIYRPVTDDTEELSLKDTVILLPNAAYEDTGIMYKVVYNGNTYQVSFRYADTSVIKNPYNVPKYLYDRFKRSIHDEVVVGHQTYSIIYSNDQSQVSAAFFIDEEHYFYTSAYTTKDELIAFLELFDYESVIL